MTNPRDLARSIGHQVSQSIGRAISEAQRHRPLPADLLESDEAYLAVVDAPGATASDVAVRVTDGRIEVQIDRFREFREGFETVFPGRALALDGSVELPPGADIDTDDATARLTDHGTLEIEIPKVERGTDVPIDAGDADETAADDESGFESIDDGDDDSGATGADAATDGDDAGEKSDD
ncbi:Hsp20/alpha crystallin family protein [Halococcoides cellulosivorans]|uniref:Molecular chaperone Hsp20 n=1 Tax=Halococcoides cellulosivorans TaxID=1679096 RepID=A0A2R4WY03_9EURY|nr:Hsp20/alpha crystallin family protein [Halococcoides cellulosivorans]AWB26418.1 molecular chaperone Hsp20 [Halococcoides cellulosivorans]